MSYDNTVALGATTWRHVAFIEQIGTARQGADPAVTPAPAAVSMRWLMISDVCKHCAEAACLDVCPTGAIIRNEFGNVYVQPDICNGCGYCVAACPFGVIEPGARRRRAQVHALLRPPRRRPGPGLRQGLPDRVDPVRPARRAARAGPGPGHRAAAGRRNQRAPLPDRPDGRGSAAVARSSCCSTSQRCTASRGPGGHHPGSAPDVEARGAGRTGPGGRRPGRDPGVPPVSPRSQDQQMVPDAEFRSYYGRPVLKEPAWKNPQHAGLPVLRRPGRGVFGARRGRAPVRVQRTSPGRQDHRGRRDQRVRGGAD